MHLRRAEDRPKSDPRSAIWEAKMTPKPIPKRSKIEAKIQETKKAIQDDLGPVLGRYWVDLGPILLRVDFGEKN